MNTEILVVVANEEELVLNSLCIISELHLYGMDIYRVYYDERLFTVAIIGTGILMIRERFEWLIKLYPSVLVLNLGFAGSAKFDVGNIIVSTRAYYAMKSVETDSEISDSLIDDFVNTRTVTRLGNNIIKGSIVSSENFVCRVEDAISLNCWDCIDMEAAEIYEICSRYRKKCYFIKYITDNGASDAEVQVQSNIGRARKRLFEMLKAFMEYLGDNEVIKSAEKTN